jgi:hypothetical protein
MYTEQLTQRYGFAAPIPPQQLTSTTTVSSGKIDMSKFKKAFFHYQMGAFGGTSPTCSAALTIQESPDGSTWTANAIVPTLTVSTQSQQATLEIRADQIGSGKRYVRLQAVNTIGGTSPTIPVAGVAWGDEADAKPGSAQNDSSLPAANQEVVN